MYFDFLGAGLFRELAEEFGAAVFDCGLVSFRELESRVSTNPHSLLHVQSLGFRLLQDAQPIRARKCFETAMALDSVDVASRIGMACALEAANRCQTAIEHLQVVLNENPKSCMTLVAMGICLERLGDLKEARRYFEHAVRENPGLTRTRKKLDNLLTTQEAQFPGSVTDFAKIGVAGAHTG